MKCYFYNYFNRTLSSEYPLILPAATKGQETWIEIRKEGLIDKLTLVDKQLSIWRSEEIGASIRVDRIASYGYLLTLHDRYRFGVRGDGSEILIEEDVLYGYANTTHLLTNQVLPMVATLQNKQVLHASAVAINGIAKVFIGESGYGKSTLAAALVQAGGELISDDCLMLDKIEDEWSVTASYPSLRLWPENAQRLLSEYKIKGREISTYCKKKEYFSTKGVMLPVKQGPTRIEKIYILENPDNSIGLEHISVKKMQAGSALKALLESQFRLDGTNLELLKREFITLSQLTDATGVFTLNYYRSYDKLPIICSEIMQDF